MNSEVVDKKEVSAKDMLDVVIQRLTDIEEKESKRDEQFRRIENALNKANQSKDEEVAKTIDYLNLLIKNVDNMEQVVGSLSKEIMEIRKMDITKDLINELASFRKILNSTLTHIPNIVEDSVKKQEQYLDINNKSVEQNNKLIERFESILNTVRDAEMLEIKKAVEVVNKNVTLTSDLLHSVIDLKNSPPPNDEERNSNRWLKMLQRKK